MLTGMREDKLSGARACSRFAVRVYLLLAFQYPFGRQRPNRVQGLADP
jgi:hypothetical protein